MLSPVKRINSWFNTATREDVNNLLSKIVLSERQQKVFKMFYLKRKCIWFIADTLCCSSSVISEELNVIRKKISVIIQ